LIWPYTCFDVEKFRKLAETEPYRLAVPKLSLTARLYSDQMSSWTDALATMNAENRAAAIMLHDRFALLGAADAEEWALSEISENIPQLARFLALRRIWPDLIDAWAAPDALESSPAAARLLAHGADRQDLVRLSRLSAYETAFALLARLTAQGHDELAPGPAPGWRLMETAPQGELTGRTVASLHESLLSLDPSGREGQDLFE
jgi:hypothetical protein